MPDSRKPGSRRPSSGGSVLTFDRRRRRGGGRGLLLGLAVVAVLAAAAWFGRAWFLGAPEPPVVADADTAMVPEPPPRTSDASTGMEPFEDLPPREESDEWLREEAAELSPDSQWPEWLGTENIVDRVVLGVVNVAAGESPAGQFPFLQPSDTFAVVVDGDRTYADPENGRRYDGLVRVITSLDAQATARFYRGVSPLLEAGLRELGFVDREFDDFTRSALDVVLEADLPEGPLEVEADGIVWSYVDPELEGLSPATKHLLRLGPDNLRRLQDWARSFATESRLTPSAR